MIDSTPKTEDTTKGSFQLERQLKGNLKADLKNSTLKVLDIEILESHGLDTGILMRQYLTAQKLNFS